jgi:hypothetical protein
MKTLLFLTVVGFLSGCRSSDREASAAAAPKAIRPGSWTGIAESRKVGPYLAGPNVYVDLQSDRWPSNVEGKQVTVTGVAVEKHDLPVFIRKPGEPEMGGIPVPPGTDLYKASARIVIENARLLGAGR